MKENEAPEKIYLSKDLFRWSFNVPQSKSDIEYTRTDAFIEKACEWLTDWFTDDSCKCGIPITKTAREKFFNNFRNYMKEEYVMKENEIPEKYKTCDWLWNYGSIGLTKEHIKRLNNAINILESVYEYTDAKYLKEIKDKLLEDKPEPKIVKIDTDSFIEKACEWLKEYGGGYWMDDYDLPTDELVNDFRNAMKGE